MSLKVEVVENPPITPVSIDDSYLLKPDEVYGGFWVRAGAYTIDSVLAILAGMMIGKFFELNSDDSVGIIFIIFNYL